MSIKIPAGLILGRCVPCSNEFRAVSDISKSNSEESWIGGKGEEHQYLSISRLTYLLVLGWLVLGQSKDVWNSLVKANTGDDLREFVQSTSCPSCFPSDQSTIATRRSSEQDLSEEIPDEVRALVIKTNGEAESVGFSRIKNASTILNCADTEHHYDRDNGVFVYYSLQEVRKTNSPNVYGSALCNSYVAGDCLVVSDLDSDSQRQSYSTSLTDDWFDPAFYAMIQRCNTDGDARAFLQRHKPKF